MKWLIYILIIIAIIIVIICYYPRESFKGAINHCMEVCRGTKNEKICGQKCLLTNMSYNYGTYPHGGYTPFAATTVGP